MKSVEAKNGNRHGLEDVLSRLHVSNGNPHKLLRHRPTYVVKLGPEVGHDGAIEDIIEVGLVGADGPALGLEADARGGAGVDGGQRGQDQPRRQRERLLAGVAVVELQLDARGHDVEVDVRHGGQRARHDGVPLVRVEVREPRRVLHPLGHRAEDMVGNSQGLAQALLVAPSVKTWCE